MLSPVKIWRRQKQVRKLLARKGVVVTWTKIYTPPAGFKRNAPYYVVLVRFQDRTQVVGQLVDCEGVQVRVGMRVISVLRKVRDVKQDDVIAYGLKFRPLTI